MTNNQIQYQKNMIQRAANEELARHNVENEKFNWSSLGETQRANRARENIDLSKLAETERSNRANEGIALSNLAETTRSNKARESENYRSNLARETETNRSNLANEAEARRNHRALESIQAAQNDIAKINADTNRMNANTQAAKVANDYEVALKNVEQSIRSNDIKEAANQIQDYWNKHKLQLDAILGEMEGQKFNLQIEEARRNNDLDALTSVFNSLTRFLGQLF